MSDKLKEIHEEAVAADLLKTLAFKADFLRHGNDKDEPDVLFASEGIILGIEIATVYYDESQASVEWKLARGIIKPSPKKLIKVWHGSDCDEKICHKIQQELNDKCPRKYVGADVIWLCIEHRGFLSDCASVRECIHKIKVPCDTLFAKIYVLYTANANEGGGFRAYELTDRQSGSLRF